MCVGEGAFGSTVHCMYCYELRGYCDLLTSLAKIEWLAFFIAHYVLTLESCLSFSETASLFESSIVVIMINLAWNFRQQCYQN